MRLLLPKRRHREDPCRGSAPGAQSIFHKPRSQRPQHFQARGGHPRAFLFARNHSEVTVTSVNKAILIGYVGTDIDMRQGANGIPITNISFYTQRQRRGGDRNRNGLAPRSVLRPHGRDRRGQPPQGVARLHRRAPARSHVDRPAGSGPLHDGNLRRRAPILRRAGRCSGIRACQRSTGGGSLLR